MPSGPSPIVILDAESGATAQILPQIGFNCFSFRAPVDGTIVEALWAEPEFTQGSGRPSRSGIPLLFPFAGRIRDGRFSFNGVEYVVTTAGVSGPNASHGFVFNRPWRVTDFAADRVTGEFQGSIDAPETLKEWPSDYRIQVTYAVAGTDLSIEVAITNPGNAVLPFCFGLHAYFRVPLGGPSADDCLVTVPADRYWPLDAALPAGEERPVDAARDLRHPKPFRDIVVDDVLTGLTAAGGTVTTTVEDPAAAVRLTQSFPDDYRFCVAFTRPDRGSIAIEPYTGAPDPFHAAGLGLDPNLILLEPGQRWGSTVTIGLASMNPA